MYSSLMAAKEACEKDDACGSVYDKGCNFASEIKLSKIGAEERPSDIGSCAHVKDSLMAGQS